MKRKVLCIEGSDKGTVFIEAWPNEFLSRMVAHKVDNNCPEPMPNGHLMFKRPADYGCITIEPE